MFSMQILPSILTLDNFFPVNLLALPSSMAKRNRETFANSTVELTSGQTRNMCPNYDQSD